MSIAEVMRLYDIQTQHNPPLTGSNRQVTFLAVARRLHDAGMQVFRAYSGTYGFYCDATGAALCGFHVETGILKVSRPYKVPRASAARYGSGYGLSDDAHKDLHDPKAVLYAPVPAWVHRDVPSKDRATPVHCTVAEYLERYQQTSRFHRVTFD